MILLTGLKQNAYEIHNAGQGRVLNNSVFKIEVALVKQLCNESGVGVTPKREGFSTSRPSQLSSLHQANEYSLNTSLKKGQALKCIQIDRVKELLDVKTEML